MTQQYLGQIPDPAQESGLDLAARLNAFDNAHRTNQSGPTRPAGILAGATWTRVVGGVYDLMVFDGAQDRIVMRVDGNLAGLPNLDAARLNLGLKALATKDKAAIVGDTTGTLSVARGGTGGTTQAAARSGLGISTHTDTVWKAGVNTGNGILSPLQLAAVIAALVPPGLGEGQTYKDVTAQRVKLTNYVNSSGRPIYLTVCQDTGNVMVQIWVDGKRVGYAHDFPATSGNRPETISAVIPPGSTYRMDWQGTAGVTVMELRA